MAKRRAVKRKAVRKERAADPGVASDGISADEQQIFYSSLPLHDLFAQQTRQMLDRTDLDEAEKETILLAMSCPCCGAGGLSFTAKLSKKPKRSR